MSTTADNLQSIVNELRDSGTFSAYQAAFVQTLIDAKNHKLLSFIEAFPDASQRQQLVSSICTVAMEELEKIWDKIFEHCSTADGKNLSKQERTLLGISLASLVYGEVSFSSLGTVIWGPLVSLKPGGVFYDLGSGTGRGVMAGALLHDFDKLVGIEILDSLHKASVQVLERYNDEIRPTLVPERKAQEISFHHGSFLDYDWSDADLVFANSTCFEETLIAQIADRAAKLKPGAYVITLTKSMTSPYFNLIHSKQYKMSWGYATVHIHVRKNPEQVDTTSAQNLLEL